MAITAKPYGTFLTDLAKGVHDFSSATYKIALLKNTYTPDYDVHATYADLTSNEVTGGNYTPGTLANLVLVYSTSTDTTTLNADPYTWNNLTAVTRYAAIYRNGASAATSRLVGLIDFGADRTYTAEAFQLSFSNGVLTIAPA